MFELTAASMICGIVIACLLGGSVSLFAYKHTTSSTKKVSDIVTMAETRERLRISIDEELDKMKGITGWFKKRRIRKVLAKKNLL